MIICDTDVMVDILRGKEPALAWLSSVSDEIVALWYADSFSPSRVLRHYLQCVDLEL